MFRPKQKAARRSLRREPNADQRRERIDRAMNAARSNTPMSSPRSRLLTASATAETRSGSIARATMPMPKKRPTANGAGTANVVVGGADRSIVNIEAVATANPPNDRARRSVARSRVERHSMRPASVMTMNRRRSLPRKPARPNRTGSKEPTNRSARYGQPAVRPTAAMARKTHASTAIPQRTQSGVRSTFTGRPCPCRYFGPTIIVR